MLEEEQGDDSANAEDLPDDMEVFQQEQAMMEEYHEEQCMVDLNSFDFDAGRHMSNIGPSAGVDFLGKAAEGQAERIAGGYAEDGSSGGPFGESNPPPGKKFGGYLKGGTGIVWKPMAVTASVSVLNRVFSEILPAGNVESLAAMIDGGQIDVNERIGKGPTKDHTLLHWAAKRGQTDLASMLLEKGADASLLDGLGRTASKLAAEEGQPFVSDIKSF